MKLAKKKNLQKGERVIYTPEVHWFFLIRPLLALFFSLALVIIKIILNSLLIPAFVLQPAVSVIHYLILANFIITGICFLWQIVEYFSIEYYITNKRLMVKRGVFSTVVVDMPIDKIESLVCVQKLLGKLFNYGTVFVSGIGGMLPRYGTVRRPYTVRKIIDEVIEKNKAITVIQELNPKPVDIKRTEEVVDIEYGTFVTSYPAKRKEQAD
ncbi:MAG: PH domain-containing protein [Treponema sp.]|jgi:uncharacterized membrane protein YdbT with pleckstrin-like domain|nr:PH domain-containing protein [Treponema sp.]